MTEKEKANRFLYTICGLIAEALIVYTLIDTVQRIALK